MFFNQKKKIIGLAFLVGILLMVFLLLFFIFLKENTSIPTKVTTTLNTFPNIISDFISEPQNNNGLPQTNLNGNDTNVGIGLVNNEPITDFHSVLVNNQSFLIYSDNTKNNIFVINLNNAQPFNDRIRVSSNTKYGKIPLQSWVDEQKKNILIWSGGTSPQLVQVPVANLASSSISSSILEDLKIINSGLNSLLVLHKDSRYTTLSRSSIERLNLQSTIFTSNFKNWILEGNKNLILLGTKPSVNLLSHWYEFDQQTNTLKKLPFLIGKGIYAKPDHTGQYILFSNSQAELYLYNIQEQKITKLPFRTFAEKCSFIHTTLSLICAVPRNQSFNISLDDWYQGQLVTRDILKMYDLKTNKSYNLVKNISQYNLDTEKLITSPDDLWLFIKDKKSQKVWYAQLLP